MWQGVWVGGYYGFIFWLCEMKLYMCEMLRHALDCLSVDAMGSAEHATWQTRGSCGLLHHLKWHTATASSTTFGSRLWDTKLCCVVC